MSFFGSFYNGVQGMNANAQRLAIIGDNIANMRTVGYKAIDAQFKSVLGDFGAQSEAPAVGVASKPVAQIHKQGVQEVSDMPLALGISGRGMFPVGETSSSGVTHYTRVGTWEQDNNNNIVNRSGYYLQGWPIDENGAVNQTLQNVDVSNIASAATPTSKISISANVQTTTTATAGYTAGDMQAGTVTPNFTQGVSVYDSQGNKHNLDVSMVKTANNTWAVEVYANPVTDAATPTAVPPAAAAAQGLLATGSILYNTDGTPGTISLTSVQGAVAGGGAAVPGALPTVDVEWANGEQNTISMDFTNMQQLANSTEFYDISQNGNAAGSLTRLSWNESGQLLGHFSNGNIRAVYQVPLATFPNVDVLVPETGGAFRTPLTSTSVQYHAADSGGAGTFSPNTLEASTTDLASEFSKLIITQKAYTLATKIVTTVDEMTNVASGLKR